MPAQTPFIDTLRPFQIERSSLRGRAVRLDAVINRVLGSHGYPDTVSPLLGELMVLAAGFAGALKFEGTFSLQLRGDGPVSLMVADVSNAGEMRGHASFDAAGVKATGGEDPVGLAQLLGKGVMALTVDQSRAGGQVYQGIVELGGRTLQEAMLAYFQQSEQVPTGIRSAVRLDPRDGRWRGGAVIVQAMPGDGPVEASADERKEDWQRAMLLLETLRDDELVDPALSLDDLLMRLFHEDGVRVFEPLDLDFACSCSIERVENMLRTFEIADFDDMRDDRGCVQVTCEFCSESYTIDNARLDEIMNGDTRQ
ncbi:MAG: Hsp33 family molecular chaperone HslO [Geminicoccaceae bacterium]|nr:Hsp33 family molecular chaperone HslO [Geminicoccaceae bacterium]